MPDTLALTAIHFQWGSASLDGKSQAWAEFAYVPVTGVIGVTLSLAVIALRAEPGRWALQHALTRAVR